MQERRFSVEPPVLTDLLKKNINKVLLNGTMLFCSGPAGQGFLFGSGTRTKPAF
mgnify:CR=1 FL=1